MQSNRKNTRENILEATSRLFARHGYDATGVASICEEAQVSKGAFYHYFSSKQEVFLILLENWLGQLEEGFISLQQQSRDVPQAIMMMAESVGEFVQETDVNLSLFLEFWTQANRDPDIWQMAVAPYRRFHLYFSGLIQEGMREGSLYPIDPDLGAHVLVSLAIGLLMQAIFDPGSFDWDNKPAKSIHLLLNGMLRRQE